MKKLIAIVLSVMLLAMGLGVSAAFASPDGWEIAPLSPEAPDVTVIGNTIIVGTPVPENVLQNTAVHGASMALPAAQAYKVTFSYDLHTWDSYNAPGTPNPPWWGGTGYWDSFSVSISQSQYWNLGLSDPLDGDPLALGFWWGGTSFGDGFLESNTGGPLTVTMAASTTSMNYLNVVLDTATLPAANHNYASWGLFDILSIEMVVDIDIKPMSDPNSINLKSKGVIPVAILTTDYFDATTVDGTTVMFAGASPAHDTSDPMVVANHQHDVDMDGDIDFVFHFRTQETNIMAGDTEATLTGMTLDGLLISGTDSVRTLHEKP